MAWRKLDVRCLGRLERPVSCAGAMGRNAIKEGLPGVERTAGLKLPFRAFRTAITFCLICFAWIFFRARTTADAFYIASHLGEGLLNLPHDLGSLSFIKANILMRLDKDEFIIALCVLPILLVVEVIQHMVRLRGFIEMQPVYVRWSLYYACCATLLFFGAFNRAKEFIYFQF